MIKINLLKNRAARGDKTAATEINYETAFNIPSDTVVDGSSQSAFVKIIVMFITLGVLWGYETYNLSGLRGQLALLNKEKSKLAAELREKQPMAEKAKAMQKEIQDIEARVQSIKGLSKIRLREIKAIDYLQNVIPEKVWFTGLDFSDSSLKIDGGAISDEQLNRFVDALEGKSYFRNVIILRSVEQKAKDGTIKAFQISSSLANSD